MPKHPTPSLLSNLTQTTHPNKETKQTMALKAREITQCFSLLGSLLIMTFVMFVMLTTTRLLVVIFLFMCSPNWEVVQRAHCPLKFGNH